jgi:hypothetical protein
LKIYEYIGTDSGKQLSFILCYDDDDDDDGGGGDDDDDDDDYDYAQNANFTIPPVGAIFHVILTMKRHCMKLSVP